MPSESLAPWIELGRARTPEGSELLLRARDDCCEIRCDGRELMSTRSYASEEAMARFACERLFAFGAADAACVLVGGLGLGYTLRAALDALPLTARVIVAELVAEVVDWNRGPLAPLAGCPLEDARVTIHVGNVGDVVRRAERCYDAILLDVDNGPAAPACRGNGWLYSAEGLAAIRRALRQPGILAVWSADPSAAFEASLRAADFRVVSIGVPARQGAGAPMHTIFLADWVNCPETQANGETRKEDSPYHRL